MVFKIAVIIVSVLFMECLAWFSHKYIMHGFMWRWHQSHHSRGKELLEKNDLFGIIFGMISCLFIIVGNLYQSLEILIWIGVGILVYGIFYFIFHDIIVHQRVKVRFSTNNSYLKRIIKAHHIHHKSQTKDDAEAFGFLYAQKKYSSKK
ncbi:MAG: beta-carotene hydroxylase [Bacteroidota bacterium]